MISEVSIDAIQDGVSYVEVVEGRNLKVEVSGGEHRAPCPFHGDTDPSLHIGPRVAHCFGCGWKGNVFQFIMENDSVSFGEAVRECARMAGVKIDSGDFHEMEVRYEIDSRNNEVIDIAVEYWRGIYKKTPKAKAYMTMRGVSSSVADEFLVGYDDGKLAGHLKKKGVSDEEAKRNGLINEKGNSRFWNRVTIPIRKDGRSINVYGRTIDTKSELRHLYAKENDGVFNFDASKQHADLYCVEACIDALVMITCGFPNVIAQLGTQGLRDRYITAIAKGKTEMVNLVIDHDAPKPGKKHPESFFSAGKTMARLLNQGVDSCVMLIPTVGEDPASFFSGGGKISSLQTFDPHDWSEKLGTRDILYSKRTSAFGAKPDAHKEFSVRINGNEWIVEKTTASSGGIKALLAVQSLGGNDIYRDHVNFWAQSKRRQIARDTGIDIAEVNRICRGLEAQFEILSDLDKKERDDRKKGKKSAALGETLAEDLKKSSNIIDEVITDITKMGYVGEDANKALLYLVGVSALMDNPLGAYIAAESAAGKSAIVEKVAALFPPSMVYMISRMTSQALYYVEEEELKHRWLIIAERNGAEDEHADYNLRTFFSEKVLTLLVPMKDEATGEITTRRKTVKGPIAYTETTTSIGIHDENATRLIELNIRESEQQTAIIHDFMRAEASMDQVSSAALEKERRKIALKHQAFIASLAPLQVRVPFAHHIKFPIHLTRARRDFLKFLGIIKAVAFVNQHQRKIQVQEGVHYIEATTDDYGVAYDLAEDAVRKAFASIPDRSMEVLKFIFAMMKDPKTGTVDIDDPDASTFTLKQVRESGVTKAAATIKKYLEPLVEADVVEMVDEGGRGRGKAATYRLKVDDESSLRDPASASILTQKELEQEMKGGTKEKPGDEDLSWLDSEDPEGDANPDDQVEGDGGLDWLDAE